MEQPPVPQSKESGESKEHTETGTTRREFEYLDAEGRLLGRAEIELEGPEVDMDYATVQENKTGRGRRLRSFVIKGEKDGVLTEMDMMSLANRHGIEVIMAGEHLQNYSYDDVAKRALVPPLETPLDIGVFLHELGHADQYHEERFDKLKLLYGRSKPMATVSGSKIPYATLVDLIDAVSMAVPDAKKVLDHESLRQLERLEDRRHDALVRKSRAESALIEQESLRSDELRTLVIGAMKKRVDIDRLLEACGEVAGRERHATPPLEASSDVTALIDRLTDAGIRFQEEYLEDGLEERIASLTDQRFPAESDLPPAMLPESTVVTAEQVMEVLKNASFELDPGLAEIAYDAEEEEMIVRTPVIAGGERRMVAVRLEVGAGEFEHYARLREGADALVRDLERRVDRVYEEAKVAEQAQQTLMDAVNMREIAALPTRMMERDATRRAFQWLRTVRQKTGVDLLATHLVPPEALVAMGQARQDEACADSTAEGLAAPYERNVEASVVSDLKNALATYGADKMRLRPPGEDKGPGTIPIAGHERREKN